MATATTEREMILVEYSTNKDRSLAVDREAGVIRGVKIIGLESVNGRSYSPAALRRAIDLYEGIKVNVNHPARGQESGPRAYQDRIGKLVNVREAKDGLRGDLQYNPKHPLAEQLAWDAENAPESVGLSHNAVGRTVRRGSRVIVEEIVRVNSVDLVADPATTKGLFEGIDPQRKNMTELTLESATLDDIRKSRPDLLKLIEQQGEQTKLVEQLQAENKTLKEEVAKLTEAKQVAERKEAVAAELKEAGLDAGNEKQCSHVFLESLYSEADAAKRKLLIEDRKALVEAAGDSGQEKGQSAADAAKPLSTGPAPRSTNGQPRQLTEAVSGWRRR